MEIDAFYFVRWLIRWLETPFIILRTFEFTIPNLNGGVTVNLLDVFVVFALGCVFLSFLGKGISIYVNRGK